MHILQETLLCLTLFYMGMRFCVAHKVQAIAIIQSEEFQYDIYVL